MLNLDLVKKAISGTEIEVYTSPETRTTYKPAPVGAIVEQDGKVVAVIDRRGYARYWNTSPRTLSTDRDYRLIYREIDSCGKYTVALDHNAYKIRAEFRPKDYQKLTSTLKSPLIAAYLIHSHEVTFNIKPPAAFEHAQNATSLAKLSAVAGATGFDTFHYADVVGIARAPTEKIVASLERVVPLPFGSKVPVIHKNGRTEFYSDNWAYCLVRRRKDGKIDVKANVCTDWREFCETVEMKFSEVIQ